MTKKTEAKAAEAKAAEAKAAEAKAAESKVAEAKAAEAKAAEVKAAEAKAAEAKAAEAAEAVKPAKRTRRFTAKTIKAVAGDVMVCGVIKVTAEGVELDAKVQSNRKKIMKHINYGVEIGTLAWVK